MHTSNSQTKEKTQGGPRNAARRSPRKNPAAADPRVIVVVGAGRGVEARAAAHLVFLSAYALGAAAFFALGAAAFFALGAAAFFALGAAAFFALGAAAFFGAAAALGFATLGLFTGALAFGAAAGAAALLGLDGAAFFGAIFKRDFGRGGEDFNFSNKIRFARAFFV